MVLPAKKTLLQADKRLEEVTLSMDGQRLIFVFENGEGYSIARKDLPDDDGTPITTIQIFDHRCAVAVTQASGTVYDLPWDSIKHYAQGGRRRKIRVGQSLKKLRKARDLTQEALARAAGMSRMQLARLEADDSIPNLSTLLKLSRVLGVPLREMV